MNEKLIRKCARDIVDTIAEMKECTDVHRFSVLNHRLKRQAQRYYDTGGPLDMESVTKYGKH